jgi:hypothetical protein
LNFTLPRLHFAHLPLFWWIVMESSNSIMIYFFI